MRAERITERALSKMFVAVSSFAVKNGMTEQVKEAFRNRPHLVDAAAGFVRMDVISPLESPDELWLITYWRDEASYRMWHKSDAHHASHKGIPAGLKLLPEKTSIRFFEHICS